MATKKRQLHNSHLEMLYRCGEKFRRVYLEGEREPSGVPALIGSAAHASIRDNMRNKINRGEMLPQDHIQDIARDSFSRLWNEAPVILGRTERRLGLKKTKGKGTDMAVSLSLLHYKALAPLLRPYKVEWEWVIECEGYPFDLGGTGDIVERVTAEADDVKIDWVSIRDTKTRSHDPGPREAECSDQLTIYSLAFLVTHGVMPDEVFIDFLIKGGRPKSKVYRSTRTREDIDTFMRRFEHACEIIEKEIFMPSSRLNWWCSEEWCGFARDGSCRFFNGRKQMPAAAVDLRKGGLKDYGAKTLIRPRTGEWAEAIS